MKKNYIKKPISIEAIQYDGTNFEELKLFAKDDIYASDGFIYLHTLEGEMKMLNKTGDYLIRGIQGEFYFCEKNVFEQSYQEVNS